MFDPKRGHKRLDSSSRSRLRLRSWYEYFFLYSAKSVCGESIRSKPRGLNAGTQYPRARRANGQCYERTIRRLRTNGSLKRDDRSEGMWDLRPLGQGSGDLVDSRVETSPLRHVGQHVLRNDLTYLDIIKMNSAFCKAQQHCPRQTRHLTRQKNGTAHCFCKADGRQLKQSLVLTRQTRHVAPFQKLLLANSFL